MEYQIQPNTRQCTLTGAEIKPGEQFYTALFEEDNQFVRRDYCRDAWQGPPAEAFSFWMGRMSDDTNRRRLPIDDEMLFDCFQRLEGRDEQNKVNFRYVLALLLMRRKRLKFQNAHLVHGHEVLLLSSSSERTTCEVINPRLSEEEIVAVQDEVLKVMGWN